MASLRDRILHIAQNEIGVREATGHNDGKRVEEYLRYTHLGKGHQWCAAFVSWCYGQAGLSQPRNPWSPALFPKARTYGAMRSTSATIVETQSLSRIFGDVASLQNNIHYADIFGIYSPTARRINHVGLVKGVQEQYLITIEGNSSDKVESRRRHLSTIYALADWIGDN
ncbi:CHAP domain-containing protein [Parapedobacter sp. SGR-10]|nr:CHAP domain-containing protein [Parapedobacter sp. SGR-10]